MSVNLGAIKTIDQAPAGDTSPDSITTDGSSTFIEYANNAQSDGSGGSSQIVQYDKPGNVIATYDVAGTVDGLKFNPHNGLLYALQNQDGNSTVTLIDPVSGAQSSPIAYAQTSTTQGYDDIVFDGKQVFESYTNPAAPTDPVIVQVQNGNTPFAPLQVTPVLLDGALGYNQVTQQANQPLPLTDPDSLKLAPNGDLLLTGGADGAIIDVHNPGKEHQYISFTQITDANGTPASGLDDVIRPGTTSGTFTLVDTSGNTIEKFKANHLKPNDYYASVDSLGGFGQVNPNTGVFTLLVPSSGAHGISFQPSTPDHGMFGGHSAIASARPNQVGRIEAALRDPSADAAGSPGASAGNGASSDVALSPSHGHHHSAIAHG